MRGPKYMPQHSVGFGSTVSSHSYWYTSGEGRIQFLWRVAQQVLSRSRPLGYLHELCFMLAFAVLTKMPYTQLSEISETGSCIVPQRDSCGMCIGERPPMDPSP